jgi:hypothetical protein
MESPQLEMSASLSALALHDLSFETVIHDCAHFDFGP